MRVLGIDPGTIVTGYGIVDDIKGQLNSCHLLEVDYFSQMQLFHNHPKQLPVNNNDKYYNKEYFMLYKQIINK